MRGTQGGRRWSCQLKTAAGPDGILGARRDLEPIQASVFPYNEASLDITSPVKRMAWPAESSAKIIDLQAGHKITSSASLHTRRNSPTFHDGASLSRTHTDPSRSEVRVDKS